MKSRQQKKKYIQRQFKYNVKYLHADILGRFLGGNNGFYDCITTAQERKINEWLK